MNSSIMIHVKRFSISFCMSLLWFSCTLPCLKVKASTGKSTTASFTVVGDNTALSTKATKSNTDISSQLNSSSNTNSTYGTITLAKVPKLVFKSVSISDIYSGKKISLLGSNANHTANLSRLLRVDDYRGYSLRLRSWVVSARLTSFVNGKTVITPNLTLDLSSTEKNKRFSSIVLTKNTTPVLNSQYTPTDGAGISTLIANYSTSLDFNNVSKNILSNLKPGTYKGQIIWNLNNTASIN